MYTNNRVNSRLVSFIDHTVLCLGDSINIYKEKVVKKSIVCVSINTVMYPNMCM